MVSTDIPLDGLIDIRWPIPGNSYEWSPQNLEPLAAKKRIVHHHTAGTRVDEDGFTMAQSHMSPDGLNVHGIGVNFVITCDEYPGRQYEGGSTPPGAQIQYVGDVASIRAGVYDRNPGSIHVEVVGRFDPGHTASPSQNQLRLFRKLIDFLLAPNNILPSLNYYSQVTYHNAIAVEGWGTSCPGWANPKFAEWFAYLQGGAEPHWWAVAPPIVALTPSPVIEVTPPTPTPETPVEASDPVPGKGGGINEYEATYHVQAETKPITRSGAFGIDVSTGIVTVPNVPEGTVIDIAGYFTFQGTTYARTVYSETHGKWNGLPVEYLEPITGQPSGDVPVILRNTSNTAPDPIVILDPTAVAVDVTDAELQAATVPDFPKLSLFGLIKEGLAWLVAHIIKKRI